MHVLDAQPDRDIIVNQTERNKMLNDLSVTHLTQLELDLQSRSIDADYTYSFNDGYKDVKVLTKRISKSLYAVQTITLHPDNTYSINLAVGPEDLIIANTSKHIGKVTSYQF